jgi:hypothetical protein
VAVSAVNQERKLIAELTGIARTESASENAQPFAHFPLVGAGNCRAGVPPIWKFSGEIDEGATAKLRIRELLWDGLEERLDLPARGANMTRSRLIPPLPESAILFLGKTRQRSRQY